MKKICTKCGIEKSIDEFSKHKRGKNGLNCWCKKCYSEYHKEHYQINIEKNREQSKQWRKKNPDKMKSAREKFKKNNPDYKNNYQKERRKNDPIFALNQAMSSAISRSLKGNKNGRHWEELVNFTQKDLRQHLEKQFKDGMRWENWGKGKEKWNIDHVIPISLFNITSAKCKGFKKCWALENLRPMWAEENIKKKDQLFI